MPHVHLAGIRYEILKSPRGVAWWQRAWDLHSRSRVRVKACTSCKNLGQPGFYSLTWAHKLRFSEIGVSSNKKKVMRFRRGRHLRCRHFYIWYVYESWFPRYLFLRGNVICIKLTFFTIHILLIWWIFPQN